MEQGLALHVVRFGRALRDAGLNIGTAEILDGLRALCRVGVVRREDVRAALAVTMVKQVGHRELFNKLFEAYWGPKPPTPDAVGSNIDFWQRRPVPGTGTESNPPQNLSVAGRIGMPLGTDARPAAPVGELEATLYAPHSLWERDFAEIDAGAWPELMRAATLVARKLATRLSRRWRPSWSGGCIDQRRTLRLALRYGGEIRKLVRRRRARRRARLVVLCDISGSMAVYARVLMAFAWALQQAAGGHRVETFAFSTDLRRVTPVLQRAPAVSAIHASVHIGGGWSGGTRIGHSLQTFTRHYGPPLVNRQTSLIILSDGLDTGEVEVLKVQMQWLRRRAGRIIWLNPLAGDPRFQPLAAGMAAALPYIDLLAPAHNLASLAVLERHL